MLQRHFLAYVLGNVYLMMSWDLLGIELRQIADLKQAHLTRKSSKFDYNVSLSNFGLISEMMCRSYKK